MVPKESPTTCLKLHSESTHHPSPFGNICYYVGSSQPAHLDSHSSHHLRVPVLPRCTRARTLSLGQPVHTCTCSFHVCDGGRWHFIRVAVHTLLLSLLVGASIQPPHGSEWTWGQLLVAPNNFPDQVHAPTHESLLSMPQHQPCWIAHHAQPVSARVVTMGVLDTIIQQKT